MTTTLLLLGLLAAQSHQQLREIFAVENAILPATPAEPQDQLSTLAPSPSRLTFRFDEAKVRDVLEFLGQAVGIEVSRRLS